MEFGIVSLQRSVTEPTKPTLGTKKSDGRWTDEEHQSFLKGLEQFGKNWKMVATLIPTRTLMQTRTHAQKYFKKLEKEQNKVVITEKDVDFATSRWSSLGKAEDIFRDLDLHSGKSNDGEDIHLTGSVRHRSASVPCPDEDGRRASSFIIGKKLKGGSPIPQPKPRSGRWTEAEEEYALQLIEAFDLGILPIPDGMMLRIFLAKALNCDRMRISKKFAGNSAIGKNSYKKNQAKINSTSDAEFDVLRKKLAIAEHRFLVESNQIPKKGSKSASSASSTMPITIAEEAADNLSFLDTIDFDTFDEQLVEEALGLGGNEASYLDSLCAPTPRAAPISDSHRPNINVLVPASSASSIIQHAPQTGNPVSKYSPLTTPFAMVSHTVFTPSVVTSRRTSSEVQSLRNNRNIEDISSISVDNWKTLDDILAVDNAAAPPGMPPIPQDLQVEDYFLSTLFESDDLISS